MTAEQKPTPRLVTGADDTAVADLPPARKGNRRRLLIIALPLALMLGGSYAWMTGGRYIETEDAYVQQNRVNVVPQVSGQIASTGVAENETVAAGQTLFTLDDATYRSAVEAAMARLASARLEVERLKAAYAQAVAEAATAREFARHHPDPGRPPADAVEVRRGQPVRRRRQRAEAAARQGRRGQGRERGRLRPRGARRQPGDRHRPASAGARGARRAARRRARPRPHRRHRPGRRHHQPDRPAAGRPVRHPGGAGRQPRRHRRDLDRGELQGDRPRPHAAGPAGDGHVDTYGKQALEGVVGSIGAGTGSEFALLPPQNATGNWVKVVQRVPVRIELDPGQDVPTLRAGMSATVEVDTGQPAAAALASPPRCRRSAWRHRRRRPERDRER